MVAFIEYQPGRHVAVIQPAERCLGHHQRMVGDHDVGAPRLTHGAFDEAFAVMGAGRIDALAAPVGESQCVAVAHQIRQPVGEIAALAHEHHIVVHTDAVQTVGKIELNVEALGVDLLSLSAHKFHGPKGVGALFVKPETPMNSLMLGGSHERHRRAGTENVPGIVGLGAACDAAVESLPVMNDQVRSLRDRLESGIVNTVDGVAVNGDPDTRMPHVTNISFLGLEGEAMLIALDFQGIAVSTGAACASGALEPSHVLTAMNLGGERIQGAIRFSLSRMTKAEDIDYVLEVVPGVVQRMRETASRRA